MAEPAPVTVRDATVEDLPGIVEIYNEVVATSDAIWRDTPVTLADRRAWFDGQQAAAMPVVVAVGVDDQVLGFASFVQFRTVPGYFPTVEHTIHVRGGYRGQGLGGQLLGELTDRARAMGKEVMVAGLDAGNTGSRRFHERLGFREVARMPGIGRKGGRPVDLVLLQKELVDP